MTDIGILPTKTGVRVNSSTGRHGDIPAVEESLAEHRAEQEEFA